jgi:putative molybdopterin biosynthesis protein
MRPIEHLSRGEAIQALIGTFPPLEPRIFPVREAVGLVLGQDVSAKVNLPAVAVSAVDGYAVESSSTGLASPQRPVTLTPGRFQWVNTGSPLPEGCDSVVMVEDCSEDGGNLQVFRSCYPGQNTRFPGEDVMAGQPLASKGQELTAQLASLLIGAGVTKVLAIPRPRVLFIPTGDEIVSEDVYAKGSKPGDVPETNSILATRILGEVGFHVHVHPEIVRDNRSLLEEAIERGTQEYDAVLISGGSAKGRRDMAHAVLKGRIIFRWLLMRPGRPAMGASVNGKPVLVLPGFPSSSMVILSTLVVPFLSHLSGRAPATYFDVKGVCGYECPLLQPMSSPPGMEEWAKGRVVLLDREVRVYPLGGGSSSLWSLAESDGLILVPQDAVELPKGAPVRFYPWVRMELDRRCLIQGSDDPAFQLLALGTRRRGCEVVIRRVGSMGGVMALSRGEAHGATCHVLDPESGRYNVIVDRLDGEGDWTRVLLFRRQQGLMVAPGNPKGIHHISDLAREDVRIANRQHGSGTRILLDHLLVSNGLSPDQVRGYDSVCVSHGDVAMRVLNGFADAALGIRSAAMAMGLDFIPLVEEPYELVYPSRYRGHPAMEALVEMAEDPEWRSRVEAMGGYLWP